MLGDSRRSHRKQRRGWLAVLMEHRTRFATFCVIGAAIFLIGLAMQAVLTGWLHMNADLSFVLQGRLGPGEFRRELLLDVA